MMRDIVVDGREKPKGKSIGNRERYIRRIKAQVKGAVDKAISERTIKDAADGKGVSVPIGRTEEPSFEHEVGSGRIRRVVPGNEDLIPGDQIPLPDEGGGSGGSQGSSSGEGMDEFQFTLTRDEFLDIFFEDLQLPDLVKKSLDKMKLKMRVRAGFTREGSPGTIDRLRTMRNSIGRRIALGRPSEEEIEEIEEHIRALEAFEDLRTEEDDRILRDLREILSYKKRMREIIAYIEPTVDVEHRHYEMQPMPATQAVVFFLMDCSGSMTQPLKDLAKRFFMLFVVFLMRFYREVHVVFIRHTSEAKEVDENEFFYGQETGGTVVSSALEEMLRIIRERYGPDWNIYAAQASDGDNFHEDTPRCIQLLSEQILPIVQYFAYVEVLRGSGSQHFATNLWNGYEPLRQAHKHFQMKMVARQEDIFPVFRELFQKQ